MKELVNQLLKINIMERIRFLIIGSNSFSGSNCIDQLLRMVFFVLGVSRSIEPNQIFLPSTPMDSLLGGIK